VHAAPAYHVDEERLTEELQDLARFKQADAWERRVRQLRGHLGHERRRVLFYRGRLIRDAMLLKPAWNQAAASRWVDALIGRREN
jgi:hypothetical protein